MEADPIAAIQGGEEYGEFLCKEGYFAGQDVTSESFKQTVQQYASDMNPENAAWIAYGIELGVKKYMEE